MIFAAVNLHWDRAPAPSAGWFLFFSGNNIRHEAFAVAILGNYSLTFCQPAVHCSILPTVHLSSMTVNIRRSSISSQW